MWYFIALLGYFVQESQYLFDLFVVEFVEVVSLHLGRLDLFGQQEFSLLAFSADGDGLLSYVEGCSVCISWLERCIYLLFQTVLDVGVEMLPMCNLCIQ